MSMSLQTLAQDTTPPSGGIGGLIFLVVWLALVVLCIAGVWKMFVKAGQPGWAAIIPIYNIYVLCKVAGRPGWWVVLFIIPIVNVVVSVIVSLDVAKAFGKSVLFGIGVWLLAPIFMPILGFGSATYKGPAAAAA
jgi:hypothetical protein